MALRGPIYKQIHLYRLFIKDAAFYEIALIPFAFCRFAPGV